MPEEIQVPTLPEVKVIQNGKPVDTSAIDNYDSFMAYLMAAAQTVHLAKIRRYLEDRASVGEGQNWQLSLTPTPQEIICAYPSQSLYIINDGPGQIFVAINALGRTPTPLLSTEALSIDFENHTLKRFYIWSAAGTVATARAVATF
jgi:hypothetical protein